MYALKMNYFTLKVVDLVYLDKNKCDWLPFYVENSKYHNKYRQ